MHKTLYLFSSLLLAAILISGCTIPGSGPSATGNGVVVQSFEPEFSEIYSGEPVNFRLLMKNLGSVEAKDVYAKIIGIEEWKEKGGGECSSSGTDLVAPDPSRGTSGGSRICSWEYTPPPIEQGYSLKYNPTARVYYAYNSGVIKLITFGSHRELRTLADSGSPLPIDIVSKTSSPIALDITTKGPIRFWEEGKVVFPLEITVNNVGGGIACESGCEGYGSTDPKNKVRIRIEAERMNLGDCDRETVLPLWKGQTGSLVCEVSVSGLRGDTQQKRIEVRAEYNYYIDKSAPITVIGRKQ